jgi:hypothetical protein
MPTLSDLRSKFRSSDEDSRRRVGSDEALVVDCRSHLSPAQIVEQKLRNLLDVEIDPGKRPEEFSNQGKKPR